MILKFNEFINEELRRIKSYSSNSGSTKSYDLIYDDPTNPKSPSSGILLRDELKEQELQDLIDAVGEFLPKHTLKYFIKHPEKSKKLKKFLVTMNNLKFLKDKESELGELRCEYCNKGPLVIYDISTRNITSDMLTNPNYKFNEKFDKRDGATCDHKNPQSKGGDKFNYKNLAVACHRCNQKKGNMSYDDWMSKINENEFTKLATRFMGGMDRDYKFTEPADNVRLRFCNVTFPDGVKMRFNMYENLRSDTETITLRPIEDGSVQQRLASSYLNLYGRKLQFDDYQAFRRIRLYMNAVDLFDTEFDGYIYDVNKLGFIEVSIEIDDSNTGGQQHPSSFLGRGIFKNTDNGVILNSLEGAVSILKKDEYIHVFKDKKNELFRDFIEILEGIESNDIIPSSIKHEGMSLIGYLYLFTILIKEHNDVLEVLKMSNRRFNKEKLIGLLYIIS